MKEKLKNFVPGGHKNIIILILSVIVLIAAVAAIFVKKPAPDRTKPDKAANTETVSDDTAPKSDDEIQAEQEAIETLIRQYRDAFARADIEALKAIYNTDNVMNSDVIEATSQIITGYENTACYIKDGMEDTSKVVFVYDDMKVADIETLIPNIAYVYVMKKDDGSYYIYPGEYDAATKSYVYSSEIQMYISELLKDSDIRSLYASTNEKFNAICASDAKVKAFVDKLTQDEEASAETADTANSTESSVQSETQAQTESETDSNAQTEAE